MTQGGPTMTAETANRIMGPYLKWAAEGDWVLIDKTMSAIDWDTIPHIYAGVHLRSTYAYSTKLPNWLSNAAKCKRALAHRLGVEKAEQFLKGLGIPRYVILVLK